MLFLREGDNTQSSMLEKFNVKELIEFERYCKDNAMWQEMKNCYAENSTVNISWFGGTGYEFVETASKMTVHAPHRLYNMVQRLNKSSTKAVSLIMMTIDRVASVEGHPAEVHSDTKVLYRTEKIEGVWKIISLDAIYEKDSLTLNYPNKNISIASSDVSKYRPSIALSSYVIEKSGGKVKENILGLDEPEHIQKLFDETEAWLNK